MTPANPTQTAAWPTRLMALAALGGLVLTFAHPSATRQFTGPWMELLCLVWLLPLAACFGAFAQAATWKRPDFSLTIGLVLLTLATVGSALASPFQVPSLLRIWPTLAGVAGFFWLYHWLHQPGSALEQHRTKLIIRGIAGFAALFSIISLLGWRWQTIGGTWAVRNDVPFGHSIYTAGALLLLLPWLVHASYVATGIRRLGWAACGAAGFVALLATSSRGGVLALGLVGALAAGLIVLHARWPARAKVLAFSATALLVVLAVFANPRLRELVLAGNWNRGAKESNTQRSAMLEAGWLMGAARPLTGWGPGTVPLVYPKMRAELSGGVDNVLQLHNTPAQVWATLGLGGALALLLLTSAVIRRLGQTGRATALRPETMAAAASLLGYGCFSLTDHQLDLPAMNALLVLNLALLFQGDSGGREIAASQRSRRWTAGISLALLAVPLWLTARDLLARHAYTNALTFFEAGKNEEGFAQLESAMRRAPYDPYYAHQLASRLLQARAETSDPAAQNQLTNTAIARLEQSLSAGCFEEFAQLNLGWLALDRAQSATAAAHFAAAAREAPHRSGVYFGLGLALRGAGREADAVRAFALEWLNDPSAYTAPVWEWPDFVPLRPKVEQEANALLAELAATRPAAVYARELWHWWSHGSPPPKDGFNEETAAFAEALRAIAQNQPPSASIARYSWGRLFSLWEQPSDRSDFVPVSRNDTDFALALARRKMRHPPPDWHGFLTAGLENEPALLINSRSERTGYGVLALHPDGPLLTDLFVRQQNRFVSAFASTLFSPKGWITARELVNRLPSPPSHE